MMTHIKMQSHSVWAYIDNNGWTSTVFRVAQRSGSTLQFIAFGEFAQNMFAKVIA